MALQPYSYYDHYQSPYPSYGYPSYGYPSYGYPNSRSYPWSYGAPRSYPIYQPSPRPYTLFAVDQPQVYASRPPVLQEFEQEPSVVNGNGNSVGYQKAKSYTGHIVYSCVVFWISNWLFGLIAFILALVASERAVYNPESAKKLGRASIALSSVGIVLTIVAAIIIVSLTFIGAL